MTNRFNARWLLGGLGALALSLSGALGAQAQSPIKIGVVQTYTGPLAVNGTDATNGFMLYWDQVGMKSAGRPVQVIKEDDAGNPAQGMERARRLVEREGVHMLAGITSSAVAYAMRDYVDAKQMPLIIMGAAGAIGLTAERASPYIFRTSFTNRQFNLTFGPYVCSKLGYKKVAVVATDFVTGHEQAAGFEDNYKAAGCEVVKKIFAPLGTVDFQPFLAQVPVGQVDAVWAAFFAADALAFIKQYDSFGLKAKLPLIGSPGISDERILPAAGASSLGIMTPVPYAADVDVPGNKPYVAAFRAKYNELANLTSESGYVSARAISTAIEKIGGKIEDKEAFLAALRKSDLPDTPMGHFRFDDKQNVIFDVYLTKVVQKDNTYVPVVVEKIASGVDQFWQYKK